jgi:trigger factor
MKEKILPELDDEFAKDCGPFQDVTELKADVRKKLEDAAKQKSDSGLRDQVVERLVDKNEVPVPPSLLQQEEQSMMRDLEGFMQMTGQSKATSMSEELHSTVHGRAERKVRAALLLGEIARL